MRIYFVGIGGSGIGPLAIMAKEAGYDVLGSDIKESSYVSYLRSKGIDVSLDQTGKNIELQDRKRPIDWVVGVSSIIRDKPSHDELVYARNNNITIHERDALLNKIINDNGMQLIAVAGTHGKTTTTAMIIWLLKNLSIPMSYSVGAKLPFGEMSAFDKNSKYFVYECDEFHNNFLQFKPQISAITGVAWDHHEVFETEEVYNNAFVKFLNQSSSVVIYSDDSKKIGWSDQEKTTHISKSNGVLDRIKITGQHFREDAWLAVSTISKYFGIEVSKLIEIVNEYPGSSRRMERIADNLYSDYAHTPEKITGCLTAAHELLNGNQALVVVYEPLTNRRQHYIKHHYKNLFDSVTKLYWVPSYRAREDDSLTTLQPDELILEMDNKHIAESAQLNDELWKKIQNHINSNDLVILISGGGGESLDEWARKKL